MNEDQTKETEGGQGGLNEPPMSTDDMVAFLRERGFHRMGSTQVNLIYVNRQLGSTITVPNLPPGEYLSTAVVRRIIEEAEQE